MRIIEKYSIGTGDRFGRQGNAQIAAFQKARENGVSAAIVWNKSNREHLLVGTEPAHQRAAADAAIKATGWDGPYYVDADHVSVVTVDRFAPYCDFYTLDLADFIGKKADPATVEAFMKRHWDLPSSPGLPAKLDLASMRAAAERYLYAASEAGKIYRHVREMRGGDDFVTEVSMDEAETPQTPAELAVILAGLAYEGVPAQTIAPKYSGRFNKGVDYVGDVAGFLKEFEDDVRVAKWASSALGLPPSLKLSIHTGSDKFSLYRGIGEVIRREKTGVHLKTAGTTWLEEIVGLAEAGGEGLAMVKEVYRRSYEGIEECIAPYVAVIDIDRSKLPTADAVDKWDSPALVAALRHDETDPRYNPSMRQLVHIGFSVVAKLGPRYFDVLARNEASVSRNVTLNLWERHLIPLFMG
jgi:hypothetical protein